jgi:hypothetical protein
VEDFLVMITTPAFNNHGGFPWQVQQRHISRIRFLFSMLVEDLSRFVVSMLICSFALVKLDSKAWTSAASCCWVVGRLLRDRLRFARALTLPAQDCSPARVWKTWTLFDAFSLTCR